MATVATFALTACSAARDRPSDAELAYEACTFHGSQSTQCKVAATIVASGVAADWRTAAYRQLQVLAERAEPGAHLN